MTTQHAPNEMLYTNKEAAMRFILTSVAMGLGAMPVVVQLAQFWERHDTQA